MDDAGKTVVAPTIVDATPDNKVDAEANPDDLKRTDGATARNEQLVNVLLKDYELAVSRYDKTDDRIIQLISVGLALIGLVVVLLRQVPGASAGTTGTTGSASGSAAFLAILRDYIAKPAQAAAKSDIEVLWTCAGACIIFLIGYIGLVRFCAWLWSAGGENKLRNSAWGWLATVSGLDFGIGKQKRIEQPPDTPIIPPSIHWTWASGVVIGLLCIIFVGGFIRPTLPPSADAGSRVPLELLWLAPLALVVFHALLIYVLYSAFGLLWYCRALSKSITIALNVQQKQSSITGKDLPVLMRFDEDLPPSRFFSFGRGNVKPRSNYILLLGSIAFLFLWVTVASFINIYASNWWEGALMLAIYFALEFNVMFALSGVGHDLEWSQRKLVDDVEGKNPEEKNPEEKNPEEKNPDEPGAASGSNLDPTAPNSNVPPAVSAVPNQAADA